MKNEIMTKEVILVPKIRPVNYEINWSKAETIETLYFTSHCYKQICNIYLDMRKIFKNNCAARPVLNFIKFQALLNRSDNLKDWNQ